MIPPLSYSSWNEILGCEQKYAFRKILQVGPDPDYVEETEALDVGSVLHKVLEDCNHELAGFKIETLKKVMNAYPYLDFETHGPLLWAMLRRYKLLHTSVGLRFLSVELQLEDQSMIGFVDLVLQDQDGVWVTDLKSAASVSRFLKARLKDDRQLNLYTAKFLEKFDKKVLGAKYRVVTKSRLKRRKDESFKDFSERIYNGIEAVEYTIPIEIMSLDTTMQAFNQAKEKQKALFKNAVPVRNFNFCESYYRPCQFWSRCHGQNFTEETKVTEAKF